jgi:dihydrofolate reductase
MATVVADMSMTLDGFVADLDDRVDHVFAWTTKGSSMVDVHGTRPAFQVDENTAAELRDGLDQVGALVTGRRLFDMTHGWGGQHPTGVPVYVVTHRAPDDWAHPQAPFTFVTDGVESAIAQAKATAGDKIVAVASSTIAQQCLDLGLLDGIRVSLVPVLLGAGIRFFDNLKNTPVLLDDHPRVTPGVGVTHLSYRVLRGS